MRRLDAGAVVRFDDPVGVPVGVLERQPKPKRAKSKSKSKKPVKTEQTQTTKKAEKRKKKLEKLNKKANKKQKRTQATSKQNKRPSHTGAKERAEVTDDAFNAIFADAVKDAFSRPDAAAIPSAYRNSVQAFRSRFVDYLTQFCLIERGWV